MHWQAVFLLLPYRHSRSDRLYGLHICMAGYKLLSVLLLLSYIHLMYGILPESLILLHDGLHHPHLHLQEGCSLQHSQLLPDHLLLLYLHTLPATDIPFSVTNPYIVSIRSYSIRWINSISVLYSFSNTIYNHCY